MAKKKHNLRRIPASAARAMLAEVLELVGERKERILIERRGKPPVALITVDDLLQLELTEARLKREAREPRDSARAR